VPRLAATLASLLLIASSIGVNIARYPRVGRTMDATAAGAAETASPSQTASEAPRVEKPEANQLPLRPEVAAPAVRETLPDVASGDPHSDRMVALAPQPVAAQKDTSVPIVDVRPMVSVGDAPTIGMESPVNPSRFQRLPPVESSGQVSFDGGVTDDGASYPTTATP
jgi:hypothetical protein